MVIDNVCLFEDLYQDTIQGRDGDDSISGGDDDDQFIYVDGLGADTITDFGTFDSGSINNGDQSNNDFIDLTLLAEGAAVTGSDLTFDNTGVPCFVEGTLIRTTRGVIPVENLREGDLVQTRDNGLRVIVWIGSKKTAALGNLAPIRIEKSVLQNDRALWLSPNHRVLYVDWKAELMFGEKEMLRTAKSMLGTEGVRQVEGGKVEYFHILFEQHEVICSNRAWTESFHPGQIGDDAFKDETREEILALFPELRGGFEAYGSTARRTLKKYEAFLL